MLRFLAGIIIVQVASVALVLVSAPRSGDPEAWLPIVIALGTVALVAAFWFATLATSLRRAEIGRLQEEFARERENLRVKAEKEKTRLANKSQKNLISETRRAESRANRRIALAVAVASGVGVLMLLSSSIALGLAMLTGVGGALGGYVAGRRWSPRIAAGNPVARRTDGL